MTLDACERIIGAPRIEAVDVDRGREIMVVRDDLLAGGSKVRFILPQIEPGLEYVFGGPSEGYAQIALARSCQLGSARATYFVAARRELHHRTELARRYGATIVGVRPGYLGVVQKHARDYAAEREAVFFPLGFGSPLTIDLIGQIARRVPYWPAEVWCTAGSGALSRGLQLAWPAARHHAVRIGFPPDVGGASLWEAPETFQQDARGPRPPFPSCSNYDAKAWRFVVEHASDGALFWNVGA